MDLDRITEALMRLNANAVRDRDGSITIIVPKPISDSDKAVFTTAWPNCEIMLGVKPNTLGKLQRFNARCVTNGTHVFVETPEDLPAEPQAVWDTICRVMNQDGFPTSWSWQDQRYAKLSAATRTSPIDSIDIGLLLQAMDNDPTLSFL
jgi:hypothetical protein